MCYFLPGILCGMLHPFIVVQCVPHICLGSSFRISFSAVGQQFTSDTVMKWPSFRHRVFVLVFPVASWPLVLRLRDPYVLLNICIWLTPLLRVRRIGWCPRKARECRLRWRFEQLLWTNSGNAGPAWNLGLFPTRRYRDSVCMRSTGNSWTLEKQRYQYEFS